jgi:hypothetical protein
MRGLAACNSETIWRHECAATAPVAIIGIFAHRNECGTTTTHSPYPGATDRPGVAQTALALARILDNPRAVSSQPPAAKVLAALLDKLRSASARGLAAGWRLCGR